MDPKLIIQKVVYRYIGVEAGYLGDFSYRTHEEFYPLYCDMTVDTYAIEATTRVRFMTIFDNATSKEKAKILRGVVERFPIGEGPKTRTKNLADEILKEAEKLERDVDYIEETPLKINASYVLEVIDDVRSLIESRNAVSAVDRIHTAMHGYLREHCKKSGISFVQEDDLVKLMKKLLNEHVNLQIEVKEHEVHNILRNLVSIADSLNPVRNQGSRAHPNENVLGEAEAVLVINTVRTIIIYLEEKLS